jgi:hypothetical protein
VLAYNIRCDKLEEKILTWLEKQGYPLEMYVAQKFRENNFSVSQSIFYFDYEYNINREIDVRAQKGVFVEDTFASIEYIIECKSSQKPWLLFSTERKYPYDPIIESERYFHNDKAFPLIVNLSANDLVNKMYPYYFDFKKVGYGITQAFTSGNDLAYKAILTLSKYCDSLKKNSDNKNYINSRIIIPILVIDNQLFELTLSDNYELKIESKEIGYLYFNHLSIVIITKSFLDTFCKLANDSSRWLMDYCKNNLKKIQREHAVLERDLFDNEE